MNAIKAIIIEKSGDSQTAGFKDLDETSLGEGDVLLRVTHSSLNYKDALALTGKAAVIRKFPMVPGIDCAGVVEESGNAKFRAGDRVILTGWGIGEQHFGAYAQKMRVPGDWLIPQPDGLTPAQAMAVGTAGLTAMFSMLALEKIGLSPNRGPAVVTGAAGGVGSMAVSFLSKAGWRVIAATGRRGLESEYLEFLGASEIVERAELTGPAKPLGKERWSAGIDSVGSTTLANLLSHTSYGGAVAACGLAGGMDLPSSVAPFIIRNITLLGIDSVNAPSGIRLEAWRRIALDLDRSKLAKMTTTIQLSEVTAASRELIEGRIRGRMVIEIT